MWDQAATKLSAGPHGLDPSVVERVQRERVLEAMTEVVAEIGYQAATVSRILARARISQITFYELFDNKEQCFLAAYDDALAAAVRARRGRLCGRAQARPPASGSRPLSTRCSASSPRSQRSRGSASSRC